MSGKQFAVAVVIVVIVVAVALVATTERHPVGDGPTGPKKTAQRAAASPQEDERGDPGGALLAVNVEIETTADQPQQQMMLALAASAGPDASPAPITIDYPLDGSIFPPEIIAPTFLWHDKSPEADQWLIDVAFSDGSSRVYVLAAGSPPPRGGIDPKCLGKTNEIYQPTPYQASARSWTPDEQLWGKIKARSSARPARVTILGFSSRDPTRALSVGRMTLTTSTDPVGAPIFYRDVPLMPSRTEKGVIKPLATSALPLIAWRLKDISRDDSRVVLTNMPTCANCHSFSADGRVLGMDIDGPSGDKGAYAIAPVQPQMVIGANDIITWNAFKDKPKGHKTIGFLSRISPDGQHVVTTVNESVYVSNFTDYRFLQVFYPTRGILAYYARRTGKMKALPGADNTEYVYCDPVWTPDGKEIVFARAEARDPNIEGGELPTFANDPAELPMQYDLYRMPFKNGRGGRAKPIKGASQNGMSNTFPKVSPDGKWLVFVKCRNGQLMRPDSELWIVPAKGGKARRMTCNTSLMNSWHSFSPNGRWMVFSSKSNTPYTQMFLTHIDEDGNDSPAILIPNATVANRAVNIPEFVKIGYDELVSIQAPTVDYYRHYERANELVAARQYEQAIPEFRKALQAEPTSARINNNLGMCLMETGRFAEAIRHFHKVIETDPMDVAPYNNLGTTYSRMGQLDKAIGYFEQALAVDPEYVMAHYNLGVAYAIKGDMDKAIAKFRKTIEIAPNAAQPHYDLGRALAQQGQGDEAIGHIRRAVELEPSFGPAHNGLGILLAQQGKLDEAIEEFKKALELDPQNDEARDNLARAMQQMQRNPQR